MRWMRAWLAQQQPGVQPLQSLLVWGVLAAVLQHKGMELTVAPGLSEGVRKAELPCAVGRCCWLPAAGSALLELRLQLQLGAEQAASCL